MSSLPPGVTDADIERHANGPMCECGHYWCDHRDDGSCDCWENIQKQIECDCRKFKEA